MVLQSTREKFKAIRRANFIAVNIREQTETEGLKVIRDIPDRVKSTTMKRNACRTKKRADSGKRTPVRSHNTVPNMDLSSITNEPVIDGLFLRNLLK